MKNVSTADGDGNREVQDVSVVVVAEEMCLLK